MARSSGCGSRALETGRRFWILGLILLLLAGCTESENHPFCPTLGNRGPSLNPAKPYLLAAHGLSEEWVAADLSGNSPVLLSKRGLTGRVPNDLDVIGNRLTVVNSGDNTVSVIDLQTGETVGCIETGSGTNPWYLVPDPSDTTRAWVSTFLSGEVLELDLLHLRVLRRHTFAPGVEGLWVSDTRVWVTLTGFNGTEGDFGQGRVAIADKTSLESPATYLDVPANPQFLFEGADGRVHVVCTGNFGTETGKIVRIENDGSAVRDTLDLGGSPARAVLAPDGIAYVAAFYGGLMAYDTANFTAVHDAGNPILPDAGFSDVVVSGDRLYAANFDLDALAVIQLPAGNVIGDLLLGDGPVALAVAPAPR